MLLYKYKVFLLLHDFPYLDYLVLSWSASTDLTASRLYFVVQETTFAETSLPQSSCELCGTVDIPSLAWPLLGPCLALVRQCSFHLHKLGKGPSQPTNSRFVPLLDWWGALPMVQSLDGRAIKPASLLFWFRRNLDNKHIQTWHPPSPSLGKPLPRPALCSVRWTRRYYPIRRHTSKRPGPTCVTKVRMGRVMAMRSFFVNHFPRACAVKLPGGWVADILSKTRTVRTCIDSHSPTKLVHSSRASCHRDFIGSRNICNFDKESVRIKSAFSLVYVDRARHWATPADEAYDLGGDGLAHWL